MDLSFYLNYPIHDRIDFISFMLSLLMLRNFDKSSDRIYETT